MFVRRKQAARETILPLLGCAFARAASVPRRKGRVVLRPQKSEIREKGVKIKKNEKRKKIAPRTRNRRDKGIRPRGADRVVSFPGQLLKFYVGITGF